MTRRLFWLRAYIAQRVWRLRGWERVYWREDYLHRTCPHVGEVHQFTTTGSDSTTTVLTVCMDCGASL